MPVDKEVSNSLNKVITEVVINESLGKKWYLSKTFWINTILIIALLIQGNTGFIIGPELQAILIALVNLVLRKVTKQEIVW